jgi:hypothetical protein
VRVHNSANRDVDAVSNAMENPGEAEAAGIEKKRNKD